MNSPKTKLKTQNMKLLLHEKLSTLHQVDFRSFSLSQIHPIIQTYP